MTAHRFDVDHGFIDATDFTAQELWSVPLVLAQVISAQGTAVTSNTLIMGLIVFVVILAGAFAGAKVQSYLPKHHLTDETKNLVNVSTAVLATVSALVLGLMISNANTSFTKVGRRGHDVIGRNPSTGPCIATIWRRC